MCCCNSSRISTKTLYLCTSYQLYLYFALALCYSFKHRLNIKLWQVDRCVYVCALRWPFFITYSIVILTLIKKTWTFALQLNILGMNAMDFHCHKVKKKTVKNVLMHSSDGHGTSSLRRLRQNSNDGSFRFAYIHLVIGCISHSSFISPSFVRISLHKFACLIHLKRRFFILFGVFCFFFGFLLNESNGFRAIFSR